MKLVKTFHRYEGTDDEINVWVRDSGAEIVDVKITSESYVVIYRIPLPEFSDASKTGMVPTVTGTAHYAGKKRTAECMAGIFGVPEDWRFSPDDDEPAPKVLLSPDCDLSPFVDLFGNVESKELL